MKTLNLVILNILLLSKIILPQWEQIDFPEGYHLESIISLKGYLFAFAAKVDSSGIFRSSDGGLNWEKCSNELSYDLFNNYGGKLYNFSTNQDDFVFINTDVGFYCSSDYGDSWTVRNSGIGDYPVYSFYYADGILFTSRYQHNYRSTNLGENWDEIDVGNSNQTAGAFLKKDNFILAGMNGGSDCLYKSLDSGKTWDSYGTGFAICTGFEQVENSIYSSSGTHLQKSTDKGETWNYVFPGLPPGYYYLKLKNAGYYLLAFHMTGIYFQHKDSTSWYCALDSLLWTGESDDTLLYAVTYDYKLWRSNYPDFVTDVEKSYNTIPSGFILNQNYPNPFNPSTKINWQSPVGSHQTIKLFNVLGKEIETIVDGYYEAGIHSTLYIVHSTLPSGVYFYQLRAGNFIQTKKMILLH